MKEMKEMLQKHANIYALTDGLSSHTDRCVWCGGSGNISPSNVIPVTLGSCFAPSVACGKCSNFLASEIERSATQNDFLRTAASGLVSTSPEETPSVISPTPETEDERPGVVPIEEFYEDDSSQVYKQCGCEFTKQVFGREIKLLDDADYRRDVDPRLVFKVAYELSGVWGLNEDKWFSGRLCRFFSVNDEGIRITFANELGAFITSNTEMGFSHYHNVGDIPFKRHHYAMLRMSKDGNLYFELVLYGVIRSLFLLGRHTNPGDRLVSLLERCLMCSTDDGRIQEGQFPNVRCKRMTIWSDAAMDWRYWQLAKDERYRNML